MPSADPGFLGRFLVRVGERLLAVPLVLALFAPLAWGVMIWRLSSHSIPLPAESPLFWELVSNLAHAPLFGILTLLVAAVLLRPAAWPSPGAARLVPILALVVAYGITDEWHQSTVPGRDASALDVLTDLVASVQVLWIVAYLGRPERNDAGLWGRLAIGVLLCVATAALALLG